MKSACSDRILDLNQKEEYPRLRSYALVIYIKEGYTQKNENSEMVVRIA
jgi:hypothetical protein